MNKIYFLSNICNDVWITCKQLTKLHIGQTKIHHFGKMPFYAVAKGKKPGIYDNWGDCQFAVCGYKNAKYKKFESIEEAQEFVDMFKGKFIESTECKNITEIVVENETPVIEIPSDDENIFNDNVLLEHLDRIDKLADEYKQNIINEYTTFKSKMSNSTEVIKRSFSTSAQSTSNTLKRSNNSDHVEQRSKICKLEDSIEPRKFETFNKKISNYDFLVDSGSYVHVYTDGACENNGRKNAKAGLGVWFGPNHPLNVGEPIKGRPTNNVGEIQACTRAIQIAHSEGIKKLRINTDSQFVINSMTSWIKNWKKRNWTLQSGLPVKNKVDFVELDKAAQLLEIKWNFVKGHAGIQGNEGADRLARKGAEMFKITVDELKNETMQNDEAVQNVGVVQYIQNRRRKGRKCPIGKRKNRKGGTKVKLEKSVQIKKEPKIKRKII